MMLASGLVQAQNPAAPRSLKTIPVPEPANLAEFVTNKTVAIALGKALYWDMQVGSDGTVACATCHFSAGADGRQKGQVNPGSSAGDRTFDIVRGPNDNLTPGLFPRHMLEDPEDRFSEVLFDANDVVSSAGVSHQRFLGQPEGPDAVERGTVVPDAVYSVGGLNVRRVEPRNAPSVINAVFNYANFWDGRANNIFNGVSPFGDSDPNAGIYVSSGGGLQKQRVRIPMSSLASQAVGPVLSDDEMSFIGRRFPDLARKLLPRAPLAKQRVHPFDSVLRKLVVKGGKGLTTTYEAMVRDAFVARFWNNTTQIVTFNAAGTVGTVGTHPGGELGPDQFTQMEANFSLFFGLAIQLYEATLVSDDAPYDRYQEGDSTALSDSAKAGLNIFMAPAGNLATLGGSCLDCHGGPEFSNASVSHVGTANFGASIPEGLLERMPLQNGGSAYYDAGYYNAAVRPSTEEPGRGGNDPFGFPLSFSKRALLADSGEILPFDTPPLPDNGVPQPKPSPLQRTAVNGAFKVPILRNVELTGPYFHTGGAAGLMQVIDHYIMGGDFHEANIDDLAVGILANPALKDNVKAQNNLIDFLLSLTDERVRWEEAPFDHPELFVPHGAQGDSTSVSGAGGVADDAMLHIPAVGAAGRRDPVRRKPTQTFLNIEHHRL
jgi:cytochrome c peroxidase